MCLVVVHSRYLWTPFPPGIRVPSMPKLNRNALSAQGAPRRCRQLRGRQRPHAARPRRRLPLLGPGPHGTRETRRHRPRQRGAGESRGGRAPGPADNSAVARTGDPRRARTISFAQAEPRALPKAAAVRHLQAALLGRGGGAGQVDGHPRIGRGVQLAIRFGVLTAARQAEVRRATWEEFDCKAGCGRCRRRT